MTNYVPSIPDCDRWKKYVSNLAKRRSESKLNSYVTSSSPLGDIKVVSPVEGDLAKVKTRLKQYKKKLNQNSNQTTQRSTTVKTSKPAKGKKKTTKPEVKGKQKKRKPRKEKVTKKKKKR